MIETNMNKPKVILLNGSAHAEGTTYRALREVADTLEKEGVEADYDSIHATVQGFSIGVKVNDRVPYSKIVYEDDGAPFKFTMTLHFDPASDPYKTDFQIVLDADLNFMMKTLLGSKLQEGLDRIVDGLVAMSEGRVPEGVDPSWLKK